MQDKILNQYISLLAKMLIAASYNDNIVTEYFYIFI